MFSYKTNRKFHKKVINHSIDPNDLLKGIKEKRILLKT